MQQTALLGKAEIWLSDLFFELEHDFYWILW